MDNYIPVNRDEAEKVIDDSVNSTIALAKESQRAAVIIGAAKLDENLETLIKSNLRPPKGGVDTLFDSDRALGTFSAKINIAYRLGIIDEDMEFVLHQTRKIRNDFAHNPTGISLSVSPYKDRIREIERLCSKFSSWKTFYEGLKSVEVEEWFARFLACIGCTDIIIRTGEMMAERLEPAATYGFMGLKKNERNS